MKKPKPEPIAIRCQHTRTMPVDELLQRQHPRNNNRHPLAQIEAFARILQHQGIRRAIVISKQTGLIITGHGLLQTLAHLDIATAPVDEQDFASEQDELAHLMADNAIAAQSELDDVLTKQLFKELQASDFDVSLTGHITADEVARAIAKTELKPIVIKPLPATAWALIGIPLNQFGRVQAFLDTLPEGTNISTTVSNGRVLKN